MFIWCGWLLKGVEIKHICEFKTEEIITKITEKYNDPDLPDLFL